MKTIASLVKIMAFIFGIYGFAWVLISFGQSGGSGKPFSQCFLSIHSDCS
jgi:hypothetical protein